MLNITKNKFGTVYLVGSGPGDVGLLTLRAKELLEKAQVVLYDHLVNPEILKFCKKAELQNVGKIGHVSSYSQEQIEAALLQAATKYQVVVRLKGGDPFIFGRGGEEAEFLVKHQITFEVVPGVTSAIAVPAYAGIPLTHRELSSSVTFVTGHEDPSKIEREGKALALNGSSLANENTLVFLMGVKTLSLNFNKLIEHGMPKETPAAIIEWGTYPCQRIMEGNLETLPKLAQSAEIEAPAIVVVGEVVKLRKQLKWFEVKLLFGKKILVTRDREQASELGESLRALGADVSEYPTIELIPPKDFTSLDRSICHANDYAWILFTSVNAVNFFFNRLKVLDLDIRSLGSSKLAAVGPATTKRLEEMGLKVERQPEEFTGKALGKTFSENEIKGKRVLLPRAEIADEALVEELKSRGALLDVVVVYQTVKPSYSAEELKQKFIDKKYDLLTFASSSSVQNMVELLQQTSFLNQVKRIPCAVIGPVTKQTAEANGFNVIAMPTNYTIPDLLDEVVRYFVGSK